VDDHASALEVVLQSGRPGAKYNIGGNAERRNIDVVRTICSVLDALRPRTDGSPYSDLIRFVPDRPGHDFRYAIDTSHIGAELGWRPSISFDDGIRATVEWYLANEAWWRPIRDGAYSGERLGLLAGARSMAGAGAGR
jgi:dTDP-glucose 4,6-dehydratase